MRECFVVTTYCNTIERVDELRKCIKNLKKFNIDILIHAHYPLDVDIQNSVKYYIYDSTNPVIKNGSKVIVRWKWYTTANKLLTIPNPDYSYAVMNQWVSSLKFLKNKDYDRVHVINYDGFINEYIFRKHNESLVDHDVVFEYTNLHPKDYNAKDTSDEKLIFLVFFSINKSFIDIFTNELTLEKYLNSKDTMLETYIMEVIDKIETRYNDEKYFALDTYKIKKLDDSQFKIYLGDAAVITNIRREDHDVYTTISEANSFDLIKKTHKDQYGNDIELFSVFGGNNADINKFEILIFDITKPINEMIINIGDYTKKITDITDKYYSFVSNFSMELINDIIDNNKLSIIINGEMVNKGVIDLMKIQNIRSKFE